MRIDGYSIDDADHTLILFISDFEDAIEQDIVDILDNDLEGLCEAISREDDEFSKALYDWVSKHPRDYDVGTELGVNLVENADFDSGEIKLESADIETGKLDMSLIIGIDVARLKEVFEAFTEDYDE